MATDEYPLDTARRVARAQLGLDLARGGALVAVDWVPEGDDRPPTIVYVFDGGVLATVEAAERVRLGVDELGSWEFAGAQQWAELLSPATERRVRECVMAIAAGHTVYLQHGRPRRR